MLTRIVDSIRNGVAAFFRPVDPEILALSRELQTLDDYLRIQNLRRQEEVQFLKLRFGQPSRRKL